MPGRWKPWKSKNSFPTFFTAPWEISQKARDFHIPTARLRGHGKVENQKPVWVILEPAPDGQIAHEPDPASQNVEIEYIYEDYFPTDEEMNEMLPGAGEPQSSEAVPQPPIPDPEPRAEAPNRQSRVPFPSPAAQPAPTSPHPQVPNPAA